MKLIEQLYQQFLVSAGVCTDTRQDVQNKLFFALSGENFNGNKFAEQALDKGALLAVIDDPSCKKDNRYWLVDNVLDTLQQLALIHRRQFDIPVIGIGHQRQNHYQGAGNSGTRFKIQNHCHPGKPE